MRRVVLAVLSIALAACAQATLADHDAGGGGDGSGSQVIDAAPAIDAVDASTCARSPCDIYAQCGCTPPQVCDLDPTMFATGGTACRDDLLHGDETLACTRSSSCAAGHGCIGGRCRRYCMTDDDCPGAGGLCVIHPTANNQPIPGVVNCTTDCLPTMAANPSCPATWACHVYQDQPTMRYLSDCAPGGTVAVGGVCSTHNDCRPGLDCVSLNPGGNQCRPNCLCPGGNCSAGTCPAGSGSCRGFTTPVVIGANTFGTCF